MNALRASLVLAGVLALVLAPPLFAQAPNFDDKVTGFLTANIGGLPADARDGTALRRQAARFGFAGCAAQPRVARPAVHGAGERAHAARARRQPAARPVRAQGRETGGGGRGGQPARN